jgi:hypothetical protein
MLTIAASPGAAARTSAMAPADSLTFIISFLSALYCGI